MPLLQILQIRTAKSTGVDGPHDGSQAFAGSQTQTAGARSASVMVAVRSGRWQMAAGAWHTVQQRKMTTCHASWPKPPLFLNRAIGVT